MRMIESTVYINERAAMNDISPENRIKLGISTCLLGREVRYDGTHKLDRFLRDTLGQYVEYVPVCPEVECGMTTPREPVRLVGDPEKPRLMTINTQIDYTDQMQEWGRGKLDELAGENLCGYIFKSKSPSSGMERIKVYDKNGVPAKIGIGIFARMFMERFPLLPVEDEGRLHDPLLRENFIERIFIMKRWRELMTGTPSRGPLVEFHTRHKMLVMAHSPRYYRELGRIVAEGKDSEEAGRHQRYFAVLAEALSIKATVRNHVNVLQHLMGYFKKQLTSDEKQELIDVIEDYRSGYVPLIVPVTILNHYVRKYNEPYLKKQWYLNPHPIELKLRTHV